MAKKTKRGRPTKMTQGTLRKLEELFVRGLSDEEACLLADIGTTTLYDYCKENPEFSERKELLKQRVKIRAKLNISKAIEDGDTDLSKATSPGGTATGFGADVIIIDDLIKSALEANNANILEGHWEWFTNTMLSRFEEGGKLIIIMTRWHSEDLAGKALSKLPESGYSVKHISMRTYDEETDTMLCEDVLSKESYFRKVKAMGADIASANYQQEPIDIKGRLYSEFKTYVDRPIFKRISAYTDTADTGKDYLASYIYGETMDKEAYILDILFTKEPMEVTEPLLARKLVENEVNLCWIESNNGGRGFARNVERLMRENHGTNQTTVKWFHQSKNKQARILTNATWLMEHVYFPEGWRNRWPELYKSLMTYQREGRNAHDDAQDALTGIAEKITANSSWLV
ncbi:TPA: phage terminase large subunit [Streptococcus pneumoniae]